MPTEACRQKHADRSMPAVEQELEPGFDKTSGEQIDGAKMNEQAEVSGLKVKPEKLSKRSSHLIADNRGFSLMQVMVGVAIMGMVSMGLVDIVSSMLSVDSRARNRADLSDLMHTIEMTLIRSNACRATLESSPEIQGQVSGSPPTLPLKIEEIRDEHSLKVFSSGGKVNRSPMFVESIQVNLVSETPVWTANSILGAEVVLKVEGVDNTGGLLRSLPSPTSTARPGLIRKFSLTIETGPDMKIVACNRIDLTAKRELDKAICDSLGGNMVANKCDLLTSQSLLKAVCNSVGLKLSPAGTHCGG